MKIKRNSNFLDIQYHYQNNKESKIFRGSWLMYTCGCGPEVGKLWLKVFNQFYTKLILK